MPDPNFVLLYVENPLSSATFYADLLGKQPVESSPTFAMFEFSSGVMLGLWSRKTVQPAVTSASGSGELAIAVADREAVETTHADWSRRGLKIAQVPTDMDFGRTFVALDPDGHRLRACASSRRAHREPQLDCRRCRGARAARALGGLHADRSR